MRKMSTLHYFSYKAPQPRPSLSYTYLTNIERTSHGQELSPIGYMMHSTAFEVQELTSLCLLNVEGGMKKRKIKDKTWAILKTFENNGNYKEKNVITCTL